MGNRAIGLPPQEGDLVGYRSPGKRHQRWQVGTVVLIAGQRVLVERPAGRKWHLISDVVAVYGRRRP